MKKFLTFLGGIILGLLSLLGLFFYSKKEKTKTVVLTPEIKITKITNKEEIDSELLASALAKTKSFTED